jgi:predicted MFS family arabinose efflux permease
MALNMGGANLGFFIPAMRGSLGLSQTTFGWMVTARQVGAALSSPLIGRLLDRYDPRLLMVVISLVGSFLVAGVGLVQSSWQVIGLYAAVGLIGLQSSSLFGSVVVARWFVRRRARAMSMVYLGIPVGVSVWFPLTAFLVQALGWRQAWAVVGFTGLAILVPCALLARRQPEDMGLAPDGLPAPEERVSGGAEASGSWAQASRASGLAQGEASPPARGGASLDEYPWTRGQALRTGAFWKLSIAFGMNMFTFGSMSAFRFPHYFRQGVDPVVAGYAGIAEGVASLVAALALAPLLMRTSLRAMAAGAFLLNACSVTITIFTNTVSETFLATTTWGLAVSVLVVLQSVMWPTYFGRRHQGSIRGASMVLGMALGALASPLTGLVADWTGSFVPVWWFVVAGLAASALLILTAPPPRAPAPAGVPAAPAGMPPGGGR